MDIHVSHLSYRYAHNQQKTLQDVDLRIDSGEWVLVSGRSGSGKTTLAYAMAGILYHQGLGAYEGSVRVGECYHDQTALYEIADVVGFVQQNADDQFCTLSVEDEIAFGLENKCISHEQMQERIQKALVRTGIAHLRERSLFELSGGEKQKVAIASILALDPAILILDEPTSNLDLESTRAIFDVLKELRRRTNLTVIVIEHKVRMFNDLFDRCIYMEDGRITYDGPIQESPLYNKEMQVFPRNQDHEEKQPTALLQLQGWRHPNGNGFCLDIPKLELFPGEIVALMGANGSGKTTLLKTLVGMNGKTEGSLTWEQEPLSALSSPQVGLVFQNADDQIFMQTVAEEVAFSLGAFGYEKERRAALSEQMLAYFGLGEKKENHPHHISYGEKKRLNLASVIVYEPRILLLDEIFIGQDLYQTEYILNKLFALREKGYLILTAIHDLNLMQIMADRVLYIEKGRMRFCLPTEAAIDWWREHGCRHYDPEEVGWS